MMAARKATVTAAMDGATNRTDKNDAPLNLAWLPPFAKTTRFFTFDNKHPLERH